ncbi:1-acyl-sn-glycerol-3-phosphate acyltransferase, partial [Thermoproteota archaeon]
YQQSPFIKEMCVFSAKEIGTSKDVLHAVIVPDYDQLRAQGVFQIKDRMRWTVESLSRDIPTYRRIARYILTNEQLPRTPLGKLKRYIIKENYQGRPKTNQNQQTTFSQEDKDILSHPICKQAYDFLCEEAKKEINLDDNIEIDLGFDSLEQITLFVEFQKFAGDIEFSDEDLMTLRTVRDVLKRLKELSPESETLSQPQTSQAFPWQKILSTPIKQEIKETIGIRQGIFTKIFNYILITIIRLISIILFRVKVKSKTNLPIQGPFIICANHASYLDAPLLFSFLQTSSILNTYFVGYRGYLMHPFLSWARNLLRLIPIEAGLDVSDSLQSCSYVLQNKKMICFFPEGMRSLDGKLQDLKKGIGIIIKELNVPVIPVLIKGSFQAWPYHKKFPRPAKITITIGEQLTPEQLSGNIDNNRVDVYREIARNLREQLLQLQNAS